MAKEEGSKNLVYRKFPLIIRVLLFIYVAIVIFFVGLMIGYGLIDNPFEVFRIETWQHIIRLMRG